MSLEKLSKQLQRELKANPQKAGALGLLAIVALWFWLPLILPSDASGGSKPVAEVASPPDSSNPAGAAIVGEGLSLDQSSAPSAETRPRWQDMRRWIEADLDMQPIELTGWLEGRRDPFVPFQSSEEIQQAATSKTATVEVPPPSPEEAGLKLSSTIIGRERRTALINGKVFGMGDSLEVDRGYSYLLVEIEPQHVVLECRGERFTLGLRRAGRKPGIDLRSSRL